VKHGANLCMRLEIHIILLILASKIHERVPNHSWSPTCLEPHISKAMCAECASMNRAGKKPPKDFCMEVYVLCYRDWQASVWRPTLLCSWQFLEPWRPHTQRGLDCACGTWQGRGIVLEPWSRKPVGRQTPT